MTAYVDSSIALRWLLQQPGKIDRWGRWEHAVTSELTRIEVRRNLDRLRLRGRLSDLDIARLTVLLGTLIGGFEQIRLLPAILERVAHPMPTTLGTLDAIHLATALLWVEQKDEPLIFLTHDVELALAAQASGLAVGPVAAG